MAPEGTENSEILKPNDFSKAADGVFGSVKKRPDQLIDELVSAQMANNLISQVGALAKAREFDLDSLPTEEQKSLLSIFFFSLSQVFQLASSPPSTELPTPPVEPTTEIEINPHPINLTLNYADPQKQPQTVPLKEKQKIMLACFAALTQAKIDRYEIPWIPRKQLTTLTPEFTTDQVYDHLFKPLRKIGLFDVNPHSHLGFRLNCDPAEVLKMLREENTSPNLTVSDYDTWIKEKGEHILIESYQLPLLKAVYNQCLSPPPSNSLERASLQQETGLGRDAVYRTLRRLKDLGIIRLVYGVYTVAGVNRSLLAKIIEAQERPINITIKTSVVQATVEEKPAPPLPLPVKKKEAPKPLESSPTSWEDDEGVKVADINLSQDTIFSLIDQVLSAQLIPTTISGKEEIVYTGLFPEEDENLNRPTILAILDYLGLGPDELKKIMKNTIAKEGSGLGQVIVSFEKKAQTRPDQLLISQIKENFADLISVSVDEVKTKSFSEILKLMDEKITERERPVMKQPTPEPKRSKFTPNEKLLNLMVKPFHKEITSASSQPSIANYVDFEKAFNYHRILSGKESNIPQSLLITLKLAKAGDHTQLNSAGMLVSALYMHKGIHNLVRTGRGEKKALETLAMYTDHLLREKRREVIRQLDQHITPEVSREYLEKCLACLDNAGLGCRCEKCLNKGTMDNLTF